MTGEPKKVLDLGCGLNPLYFPYKDIEYIAVDINKPVLKKVKSYFKKNKIHGQVICTDIKDPCLVDIKNIDIVLAFKIFDYLTKNEVNAVLKSIKTKWFIISFPTRTVSGKRMDNPRRRWFEKTVKMHKILRFHNEIFYIIKNSIKKSN